MMRNLLVRNAMSSDIEKLLELRLSLQKHGERSNPLVWRITKEGETLLRQKLEDTLTDSNSCIAVAEANDGVVGYAIGQVQHRTDYLPATVGAISTIYVAESFRRRRVGRCLVKKLCEFFIRERVEQVTLRYIVGNKEAERFWSKLGFEPLIITVSASPKELQRRLKPNPIDTGNL
jgi:ribosomal protein S18 acetylase RimI-like enzyme